MNPPFEPIRHEAIREKQGLRPGGFGILVTQNIIDELIYGEKGNEVVLIKYLKPRSTGRLKQCVATSPAVVVEAAHRVRPWRTRRLFDQFHIQLDRDLIPDHGSVKSHSIVRPVDRGGS